MILRQDLTLKVLPNQTAVFTVAIRASRREKIHAFTKLKLHNFKQANDIKLFYNPENGSSKFLKSLRIRSSFSLRSRYIYGGI